MRKGGFKKPEKIVNIFYGRSLSQNESTSPSFVIHIQLFVRDDFCQAEKKNVGSLTWLSLT